MKIHVLSFISLLFCLQVFAYTSNDFGASASLYGSTGNTNFDSTDASNASALPALMSLSEKNLFSFNLSYLDFKIDSIDNIVIGSEVNGAPSEVIGSAGSSVSDIQSVSLHASFKVFKSIPGKLNFSFFSPLNKLLQADTTDPYLPDYPLLKRYERVMMGFNYAVNLDSIAISLGALTGIQSSGNAFILGKTSGSGLRSSGQISQDVTPSIALTLSLLKKVNGNIFSFRFEDENKSNIEIDTEAILAEGAAQIGIDWKIDTQVFYDPRRFTFGFNRNNVSVFLEYQDWSGYQSPILKIKQKGGILVSSDFERNYETKNIIVPSLTYKFKTGDINYISSIKYRQSPLSLNDFRNGNTIAFDKAILALGASKSLSFGQDKFRLSLGLQYHILNAERVNKSTPREDGQSGRKIGSGGYKPKGHIIATSFGINWII